MRTTALIVIILSGVSSIATAQPPSSNAAIAEAVAEAVASRYVFPDVAPKIAARVRERAQQGAYTSLAPGDLADALTRDLRTVNGDRHLYVQYQPGQSQPMASGPVRRRPGDTPTASDAIRRRNYFLNRAERLDGNVGYLEIRQFFGQTEDARAAAAGAMAFLAQTDAMIIDVRNSPGGDARMVDLIASYFFDKVTPTLATYSRSMNDTIYRSTLESVPGRRRPDIPVFVLTSRDTGSAAEDFAFLMQQTGRATLVGDRTAGAGHSNALFAIGGGFTMSVSIGRTFNPKTNEGWEGTGVQPTVRVAPTEALDIAHDLALAKLMETAADAPLRQDLRWTREALAARRTPVPVDEGTLKSYVGEYGSRQITFDRGRLWFQRTAESEKNPLLAISRADFALPDGQRLQFAVVGADTELRLLIADGTSVPYRRVR